MRFTTSLAKYYLLAIIAFVCFSIPSSTVYAKVSPSTLSSYIQTKCKQNCVDTEVLQLAVKEAGNEFGINPLTLMAIAGVESGYRAKAINKKSGKSVGLMQIQVFWHKSKFQSKNYFDIFDNVRVGAMIYKECVDKYKGSREKALWCYNGHTGHGAKIYVPKVLAEMKQLSRYL